MKIYHLRISHNHFQSLISPKCGTATPLTLDHTFTSVRVWLRSLTIAVSEASASSACGAFFTAFGYGP